MNKLVSTLVACALGATLLAGMTVSPASAEVAADQELTLPQLEDAVTAAEAVVEGLELEIANLERDLVQAEADLAVTILDRDAQLLVVSGLQATLDAANEELTSAKVVLSDLQAAYDACDPATTGRDNGNGCRNPLKDPISAATSEVVLKQAAADAADLAHADAAADLAILEAVVVNAAGDVTRIEDAIKDKQAELAAAEADLAAAELALASYVPPQAETAHAGCKGLAQAAQSNAGAKGKGPVVVAAVAAKLGC